MSPRAHTVQLSHRCKPSPRHSSKRGSMLACWQEPVAVAAVEDLALVEDDIGWSRPGSRMSSTSSPNSGLSTSSSGKGAAAGWKSRAARRGVVGGVLHGKYSAFGVIATGGVRVMAQPPGVGPTVLSALREPLARSSPQPPALASSPLVTAVRWTGTVGLWTAIGHRNKTSSSIRYTYSRTVRQQSNGIGVFVQAGAGRPDSCF